MGLVSKLDFVGAALAFLALLVFGAGEAQASTPLRAAGLALLALGLLLMGLHAIAERQLRFGLRLRSMHVGIGAQLMGGVYVVAAAAAGAALVHELRHPGTLGNAAASREGLAVTLFFLGTAGVLWGAALVFGRSYGPHATPGWLTLPRRLLGFVVVVLCLALAGSSLLEILAPGSVTRRLPRLVGR